MKQNPMSRRFFLQGMGGSLLALPLLPSLMPKTAYANGEALPKFLVIIGSEHGGTGFRDWYPAGLRDPEVLSNSLNAVDYLTGSEAMGLDHKVRWAYLRDLLTREPGHPLADPDNGRERLSYILGSHFNSVIDKMNFYQGIDLPGYAGHGTGIISGSISKVSNNQTYKDLPNHPSMDYFLARHPKFYGANSDNSVGSVIFPGRPLTIGPDNSSQPDNARSVNHLYNNVFSKYESGEVDPERLQKTFLVDRVLEDYNRLVKGAYGLGRKMASEDKRKIEKHVSELHQVQKKFEMISNSCSDVNPASVDNWGAKLDLLVAAFNCGATRLSTIWSPVMSNHSNYHQDVAHRAANAPEAREFHSKSMRAQSETVVGQLVQKLDAVDHGSGKTLLDSSLVFWQHESGITTHSGKSVNLVSFGGAGGSIQTGKFLDYRNFSNYGLSRDKNASHRPGLMIQQWWSTVLQAMGLDKSDYEYTANKGYGPAHIKNSTPYEGKDNLIGYHGTKGHTPYPQRVYDVMSDKLPLT